MAVSMSFMQNPTPSVRNAILDAIIADQELFDRNVDRWSAMIAVFRKHNFDGNDLYYLALNANIDTLVMRHEDVYPRVDWLGHVKLRNAIHGMVDTAQYIIRESILAWTEVPALPIGIIKE